MKYKMCMLSTSFITDSCIQFGKEINTRQVLYVCTILQHIPAPIFEHHSGNIVKSNKTYAHTLKPVCNNILLDTSFMNIAHPKLDAFSDKKVHALHTKIRKVWSIVDFSTTSTCLTDTQLGLIGIQADGFHCIYKYKLNNLAYVS